MGVNDAVGLLGGQLVDRDLVLGISLRVVRHDEVTQRPGDPDRSRLVIGETRFNGFGGDDVDECQGWVCWAARTLNTLSRTNAEHRDHVRRRGDSGGGAGRISALTRTRDLHGPTLLLRTVLNMIYSWGLTVCLLLTLHGNVLNPFRHRSLGGVELPLNLRISRVRRFLHAHRALRHYHLQGMARDWLRQTRTSCA